jgi:hypothetical protein
MDPEPLRASNGYAINGQRQVGELVREASGARAELSRGVAVSLGGGAFNVDQWDQDRRAPRNGARPGGGPAGRSSKEHHVAGAEVTAVQRIAGDGEEGLP